MKAVKNVMTFYRKMFSGTKKRLVYFMCGMAFQILSLSTLVSDRVELSIFIGSS